MAVFSVTRCTWIPAVLAMTMLASAQVPTPPAEKAGTDRTDIVFLGDVRPVLLSLRILIDGKSVQVHQKNYLERWFRYVDVDGDGLLSAEELRRAPSGQAMSRWMTQDLVFRRPVESLRLTSIARGDKVTPAEFQAHYGPFTPPLQVFMSLTNVDMVQRAGKTIFLALDANSDGKLSRAELGELTRMFRRFDVNDDEWLTIQELTGDDTRTNVQNIAIFQHQGYTGQVGSFYHIRPGQKNLPALLLARYDRDSSGKLDQRELGLDRQVFAKLDANGDGALDAAELAHWHERPAELICTVELGKDPAMLLHKAGKDVQGAVSAGTCRISDRGSTLQIVGTASPPANMDAASRLFLREFASADGKKNGFVRLDDLNGPQFEVLRQFFILIDRDSDGKMTEAEVQEFVKLSGSGLGCCVSLSYLAGTTPNLFQFLDENGDGRLSRRELLQGRARLEALCQEKAGFVTTGDLPVQHQLMVTAGQARFYELGRIVAERTASSVPEWFRKMDQNGDGDVSRAEFLGSPEEFARIDADHDGLISADEAIRHDRRVRTGK